MLALRVVVLVSSLVSVRSEMCSTLVSVAPGDEGKSLSAKAFAEFTAKCRKERSKVSLKSVTTRQPLVTTKLPLTTTSVPPSTTAIPPTTAELPSITTTASTTPLTACATIHTASNDNPRIPANRDFTSYPVVLLFTLLNDNSNLIELRFMNAGDNDLYTIAVRRGSTESSIDNVETVFDHEFDASIVFRMSYGNGEISLGVDGSGPSMKFNYPSASTNDVKYIELYSKTKTPTVWTFYRTCVPTFMD